MNELIDQDLNDFVKFHYKVFVMFGNSNCDSCTLFKSTIQRISKKYKDITFIYIDLTTFSFENTYFPINEIPAFGGYVDGILITNSTGGHINNVENIIKIINNG